MNLSKEHQDKIASSALSNNDIEALQLDSWGDQREAADAPKSKKIQDRGWKTWGDGSLRIPYLKPDGQPEECHDGKPFYRYRLCDEQIAERKRKGEKKPPKYLSPKGEGCRLYHSHLALQQGDYAERLQDRFTPIRITEGELKTESANAHDPVRLTIGLGGVNSWKDRYDGQGKGEESKPLADWDEIPLKGREVRLCFDSDLQKPQVAAALQELSTFLLEKGARVLVEVLPNGLDGERLGLDDLIHRHGPKLFQEIANVAKSPFKERRKQHEILYEWCFNPEPSTTHQRNVYLVGLHGRYWRSSPDAKDRWQRWTGTHWEEVVGDDLIAVVIEGFMDLQGWQNRELSVVRSLQAAFRRSIDSAGEPCKPGILPFRNGCLILADMQLVPHQPEHGNTWSLSYDFNAAARCPGIEDFLADRLEDPAAVALFRAQARALLLGERQKCFLEITGASDTGKTVIANLLQALVGISNTAAMELHRLEDRSQRFETIKLRGKRLAIFSECQEYSGHMQTLKSITGGDPVPAEIKNGRHIDFIYEGGVVLVGNGPVRASDPTGAVINRRRSLPVTKVVAPSQQRTMLIPDTRGGWTGELAHELSGFVNWALAMKTSDARSALARDVKSISRAEAELETLLSTDLLADWANEELVWDETPVTLDGNSVLPFLRVGMADGSTGEDGGERFLFPCYTRFVKQNDQNSKPLSLKVFKRTLVDLLRDTLGLPMPPGSVDSQPAYKIRVLGSVVPCLRWRTEADNEAGLHGVVRYAFLRRVSVTDMERIGNDKKLVGNGCNGCNESDSSLHMGRKERKGAASDFSYMANDSTQSVSAITPVTDRGFGVSRPITDSPRSVTQGVSGEVKQLTPGAPWHPHALELRAMHGENAWEIQNLLGARGYTQVRLATIKQFLSDNPLPETA